MSAAKLVARLAQAGLDPSLLSEVAEALFTGEIETRKLAERREKDKLRQRKSRDVTGQHVTDCDLSLDKKPPQTPSKTKPNQVPPIIPQIEASWQAIAERHGLPKIEGIKGKRLKALMARIDEHGEEAVFRAISNVPNSPHWLGANGWLGNFDSLMRPDNFQRMIEGAYATKAAAPAAKPPTSAELEERARFYDKIGKPDDAAECRRKLKVVPIGDLLQRAIAGAN